jgi:putative selenate reductase FAD-binding subunit
MRKLNMITEYHRPTSLEELLHLVSRKSPRTIVLGGGLYINEIIKEPIAVADLQNLGMTAILSKGKDLRLGAAVTLQAMLDSELLPLALQKSVKHQETNNRRQVATLAGSLITANGRSAVAGVFLALDAELVISGEKVETEKIRYGDFLPVREEKLVGRVITEVNIPTDVRISYQYVARSPADLPIVGAAVAQWPSGRTRAVLIGYGDQPVMVLDGPAADGIVEAAKDAYSTADDQWAGAAYRSDTAGILVKRCLEEIVEND